MIELSFNMLNKHTEFFKKFHIEFENIQELMSRDFILHFKSNELCLSAFNIINKITDEKNKKIFGDIEIKGKFIYFSIFDEEILEQTININQTDKVYLKNYVNFVA